MVGMLLGHVPWLGGHAGVMLSDMGSDAFVVKIDLYQLVTRMQFHLFAYAVMGDRVEMLLIDQVIIDIDASGFDIRVLVSIFG